MNVIVNCRIDEVKDDGSIRGLMITTVGDKTALDFYRLSEAALTQRGVLDILPRGVKRGAWFSLPVEATTRDDGEYTRLTVSRITGPAAERELPSQDLSSL